MFFCLFPCVTSGLKERFGGTHGELRFHLFRSSQGTDGRLGLAIGRFPPRDTPFPCCFVTFLQRGFSLHSFRDGVTTGVAVRNS